MTNVKLYRPHRDHLALIAKTHVRYSVRGGAGLVFTFLTLVTGLVIASIFIEPLELLRSEAGGNTGVLLDQVVEAGRPALRWALGAGDEQITYLLHAKPALVSAFLISFMFVLPFLICLGSFNQFSGDIANRGFRYLLLRTERINIYLGRFIGTYIFSLLVLALLLSIIAMYMVFKADFYPTGDVLLWFVQGFFALAIYALPHVALCAWVSAAVASPFGTLVLSMVIVGAWPLLITIAKGINAHAVYGGYVMPWAYKYWLFHPDTVQYLGGVAVMLAFTAIFLVLGARHFQQRDL